MIFAVAIFRFRRGVDGILVTGDISYGAKFEEFASAHKWLKALAELVRCDPSHVWTVPGNHDVDRSMIGRNTAIFDTHEMIRAASDKADALSKRLRDPSSTQLLLDAFKEYNSFAKSYQSETLAGHIWWESRLLAFSDGTPLVLRGLNSCLISDGTDKKGRPSQVVGLRQVQLTDGDGAVHMTLCHHPPDWLHDQDDVRDHLNSRARIQLYGHKHRQRVEKQGDKTVVMAAGALHPDRSEGDWDPRYNVLRLQIVDLPERSLQIEVFERAWDKAQTTFDRRGGNPADYPRRFSLPLPTFHPIPPAVSVAPSAHLAVPVAAVLDSTAMKQSENSTDDQDRRMVYDLFELSYPVRMKLFLRLGLVRDEDVDISDAERVRRALSRAKADDQLVALRDALKTALGKK